MEGLEQSESNSQREDRIETECRSLICLLVQREVMTMVMNVETLQKDISPTQTANDLSYAKGDNLEGNGTSVKGFCLTTSLEVWQISQCKVTNFASPQNERLGHHR